MTLGGAPNDLINNFNPLMIIAFTPILTYGLYRCWPTTTSASGPSAA